MKQLSFSQNWNNKLDNKCFTTIRLTSRFNVGDVVNIDLKGSPKGPAKVVDRRRLDNLEKLNDWMCFLDTGYGANETKNIIKRMHYKVQDWNNQPVYYYLLTYINKK